MLRNLKDSLDDFRAALRPDGSTATARPGEQPGGEVAAVAPPTMPAPPAAPDRAPPGTGASAASVPGPGSSEVRSAGEPDRARRWRRVLVPAVVGLVLLGLVGLRWAPWGPREPADPEVVASYQGGTVTREQLKRQLAASPQMDQRAYRTPNGLKALVGDVVVHEVTRRWAEERQVDQKDAFKEAMKHVTERIQIADVSDQLHQGRIQVGQAEMQAYYDQNRAQFGERPLVEVQDQIRRAVVEQKEQAFIEGYLKDLKERASLQVDYSLLDVPEPTEQELASYYQTSRDRFRVPEQARVAQIQVSVSLAGGDAQARAKAESVRARVAAGEDFTQLHH